jgi:(4S)-4-hydroxy-5-phosphonooxypentane-2,3-dione isomerase
MDMPFLYQYRLVSMLVVHVHIHVKPEFVERFRQATVENARQSLAEPGIARFDVLEQGSDPTRFVLMEVYRVATAAASHKTTAHYQVWRDTVAEMMAEPRTSLQFTNVFPEEEAW